MSAATATNTTDAASVDGSSGETSKRREERPRIEANASNRPSPAPINAITAACQSTSARIPARDEPSAIRTPNSVVRADTEDELVTTTEAHVVRDHPDLVGKLSREDILGMAVEDD